MKFKDIMGEMGDMKKIITFLTLVLAALVLTACSSENNIPLTEKESDAIAQYCAHLLLKYDNNKVQKRKLMDLDELEDYYKELHKNDPTPTPVPTEEITPTPAEDITSTPVPDDGDLTPVPTEPEQDKAESLTELYGLEDFIIEYKASSLSKVYSENEYSSINAKDGELILAVEFSIRNIGSSDKKFVSSGSKIAYALQCKNGDIYTPSLSMLGNDIQFLNDEIEKDEQYTAVLLFIIDEKVAPVSLRAEDGETGRIYDIELK